MYAYGTAIPQKAKTHTIGKKAKGIKPRAFMRRV